MIKNLLLSLAMASALAMPALADETDSEGRLVMYVRGEMTSGWSCQDNYRMTRNGDTYSITLPSLNGKFKVSSSEWTYNYGSSTGSELTISDAALIKGQSNGSNLIAQSLTDVTIRLKIPSDFPMTADIAIDANGHMAPELPDPSLDGISGTLPVMYINVYGPDGVTYDNEVIDRNLSHKNYFSGVYWLDTNGCEWLEQLGAESVGSEESPLPLEIKARGNFTRLAFAKKPFKLKLGKKQSLLGLTKSKHFALLAHADDGYGYLRNFTGFSLGRRIGLPWTPWQQPVEVVINGDYRGLYFLTESIRIEEERINITELDDNVSDPNLVSGGYLVELDNYDEENQIRMPEKSYVGGYTDMLRITWDTPEVYSDLQKRFVTDQFSAMNDLVGANSDQLWSYLDIDDAVRYYIVEEIISHVEAYHGSTYLFRDRGEGQKWHFSPLWDCGNGFNGSTHSFLYNGSPFGNTWIPSIRANDTFNSRLRDTWLWFMSNRYNGLIDEIDEYVDHISEAAKADRRRWKDAPRPDYEAAMDIVDNSDMQSRRNAAVNHLNAKTEWLRSQFGDYTAVSGVKEPERDTTPAAPLPDYAKPDSSAVGEIEVAPADGAARYFNLQGMLVKTPVKGQLYIKVTGAQTEKIIF